MLLAKRRKASIPKRIPLSEIELFRALLEEDTPYKQRICVRTAREHWHAHLRFYMISHGVSDYVRVPMKSRGETYFYFAELSHVCVLMEGLRAIPEPGTVVDAIDIAAD